MYSYLKPIGFAEKLVQKYESLATRDLFLLRFVFFFTPILVIFILQVHIFSILMIIDARCKFWHKIRYNKLDGFTFRIDLCILCLHLNYEKRCWVWWNERNRWMYTWRFLKKIIFYALLLFKGSDGFFKQ